MTAIAGRQCIPVTRLLSDHNGIVGSNGVGALQTLHERYWTGAKGLNSAVADVSVLSAALIDYFIKDDDNLLQRYSDVALERNWQVQRFSWANTAMYHNYPDRSSFDNRMQEAQLRYLVSEKSPQIVYAENHTGLPIEYWPDI